MKFPVRRNFDRRNLAGGLAEGMRTVRRGGWFKFGDDYFYSKDLEGSAGKDVFVYAIEDAFMPDWAECVPGSRDGHVRAFNVYKMARDGKLPEHLEFLRPRLGRLK